MELSSLDLAPYHAEAVRWRPLVPQHAQGGSLAIRLGNRRTWCQGRRWFLQCQ